MSAPTTPDWIRELDLDGLRPPEYFRSLDEVERLAPPHQAQVMRQAWRKLGLSGIMCFDGTPEAYLAEVGDDDSHRLRELHLASWSQGVAPLLIAITPSRVLVFSNLALPAKPAENVDGGGRLVEVLNRTADALELRQFSRSIQFGTYFDGPQRSYDAAKSFDPQRRVDRYLLKNLTAARKQLEEVSSDLSKRAVHGLLARVIFTCYLVDRTIIDQDYFAECGAVNCSQLEEVLDRSDPEATRLLYSLFAHLQEDFNGDLLDADLSSEAHLMLPGHLEVLRKLLRGDDLTKEQPALGFWAYNFSIIPIETISAIYESFIEADDPQVQRDTGAFYTPRYLSEIVLDEATAHLDSLLGKRFLDPSCGSGIFLVGLFNRLAELWKRAHPEVRDNIQLFEALKGIVRESLFGIDINETACRIAAFSLYLAMLDQLEPKHIRQLPKPRLPKIVLMPTNDTNDLGGLSIVCANFFDPFLAQTLNDFDVIVGNPPWTRKDATQMSAWLKTVGKELPQGQLAAGFILKAPGHLKADGRIAFVLPYGVLFNHQGQSLKFQKDWLTNNTVERVLNLADLRRYLFENAIRPALTVTYSPGKPQPGHKVAYLAPKSNPEVMRTDLLSVSWLDSARITLGSIVEAIDEGRPGLQWKRHLWAMPRDRELLDRLDDLPTLGDALKTKGQGGRGWVMAEGFQPLGENDKNKKGVRSVMKADDLFVAGRGDHLRLLLFKQDCGSAAQYTGLLRTMPRATDIFKAPHVLVSKGLRSAYADFDVYFRHALRGIHGPQTDRQLLMFLGAILSSDLIAYYYFHSSANWGMERDEVHVQELKSLPLPIPEGLVGTRKEAYEQIVRELEGLAVEEGLFGQREILSDLHRRIQPLIFNYYGLTEEDRMFVQDTLSLWRPSSLPERSASVPALRTTNATERGRYVHRLCATVNRSVSGSPFSVKASIILSSHANLAVVMVQKQSGVKPFAVDELSSWPELDAALTRARDALYDVSRTITLVRDLKIFLDGCLYLFKPLQRRYWAESVAITDADEIVGEILSQRSMTAK